MVVERVGRTEDVVLDTRIERRRIREHAFEERRRERDDRHPSLLDGTTYVVNLLVREIDHVAARHEAHFRTRHADAGHPLQRGFEIRGEFVGNGGSSKQLRHLVADPLPV